MVDPGVHGLGEVLSVAQDAVVRSGRRISQNARLAVEAFELTRQLKGRRPGDDPGHATRQATVQSWYAENFCTVNGVVVEIDGALPPAPAILLGRRLSAMDLVFVTSLVPCVTFMDRKLVHGPMVGLLVDTLGIRLIDSSSSLSADAFKGAIDCGTSVLLLRHLGPTHVEGNGWIDPCRVLARSLGVSIHWVDVEDQGVTLPWLRAVKAVTSRSTSIRVRVRRIPQLAE